MSRIALSQSGGPVLETKPAPFHESVYWAASHDDHLAPQWPNIFMTQDVYLKIAEHAESEAEMEVGGMLVGQAYFTPEKEMFIIVEAQLEARHVEHSAVHLTFTSETLMDILGRLDDLYPGRRIVGWYHTHPGLSVFLSSMDIWLHTHFFPEPWQVALVVDPYANHGGFFYYPGGGVQYVHPKHYTGFYELIALDGHSLVTWYNLEPEPGTLHKKPEVGAHESEDETR